MTPQAIVAALLAVATALSLWRSRRRYASWRSVAVWAQPLAAVAFYFLLFPPALSIRNDRLTILTPDAIPPQAFTLPSMESVVALPGAAAGTNVEHAPDLATALRRHTATTRLKIVGAGLPARDQDAAAAMKLALQFEPVPEHGLVELHAPAQGKLGTQWTVSGRVAAHGVRIELHDPSAAIADTVALDRDSRFHLSAQLRAIGPVRFELRVLDARQKRVETVSVPVIVHPGEIMTVIVRAGSPDPELKYWRRWAADAGLNVRVSAGLSEGINLREGDTLLTPAALAQADLVILDPRAWVRLTVEEKIALRAAISDGLGLLLRADDATDPAVVSDWASLGFRISATDAPRSVTLDRRTGLRERAAFTLAPVAVEAPDAVTMLSADDGEALAWWRNEGRGRIGLWRLLDSYRLTLLGEPARYGTLWAQTLAAVARAQAPAPREPGLPTQTWIDERAVLCGLGDAATIIAPDGKAVGLTRDGSGCAGYWPAEAGWHTLQTAAASWPFYVRAADDGRDLRNARNRAATERLVRTAERTSNLPLRKTSLPRWPFFFAWLLSTASLWWRERPDQVR